MINKEAYRVAIILPIYNAQEFIEDCLTSILNQTYPYWRAYCVDDGSKDQTSSILDDYANKDGRFLVYHIENGGAAYARNYALSKLQGEEWISFVDADDYIGPSFLESIFKAIGGKEIDYVRLFCCRTSLRYSDQSFMENENKPIQFKEVSKDLYFNNEPVGGFTHSLFIKKSIVKNHGISFSKNMVILEDQAFSISCAAYANRFLILESPKNYYYFSGNEQSITKQKRNKTDDIIRCINIVFNAFVTTNSLTVLNDFFYDKYLPIKIKVILRERIRLGKCSYAEQFLPEIKIHLKSLPLKVKKKFILAKLLRVL